MPWNPSGSAALQSQHKDLPSGFSSIQDFHEDRVKANSSVSVIGLVKDFRAPISTSGKDWKCAMTLYDKSTEDDGSGLLLNIFRPENDMPQPSVGDVVIVYSAKAQWFRESISLLSNYGTSIHVYAAAKIPKPPRGAAPALQESSRQARIPNDKEHQYVSWLYHAVKKDILPDAEEFQLQAARSLNVKDKFCALKDVRDSRFCDTVGQVVKQPFEQLDKMNLWVSDYTENDKFYQFSWDGTDMPEGRDGDPYGYTITKLSGSSTWPGPFGRRSMQITCYEPHADYVRTEVKVGDWVKIRNMQIKHGHNGNNLEGFLREDRGNFGPKLQIERIDTTDAENVDAHLKEAIRRKRDYEKKAKQQKKSYAANEVRDDQGIKRKFEEDARPNSKQRRKEKRAAAAKKVEQQEIKEVASLGLNELIKCESLEQPVFAVSSMLEPIPYTMTVDGQELHLTLPFTNAKYLANVRVVNFQPSKLEDFAVWRKNNEYDMLSDYSGGSDFESDEDDGTLDRYAGEKTWEWRFALQLEEAGKAAKKGKRERLWAVVDNIEAQQLLNLDAVDLRANPEVLSDAREQLFKLWGNLEEVKIHESQKQFQSRKRVVSHQPPDSSDGEESHANQNPCSKQGASGVSNKPFTCCIRQYGVRMRESEPSMMTAGEGHRWERTFGLFGTKICS